MTTVYACSEHQLAKIDPREPWSATKYVNALHFRDRIRMIESTCYKCAEAAQASLNRILERRRVTA